MKEMAEFRLNKALTSRPDLIKRNKGAHMMKKKEQRIARVQEVEERLILLS